MSKEQYTTLPESYISSKIEIAFANMAEYEELEALDQEDREYTQQTSLNREAMKEHLQSMLDNPRYVICDSFEEFVQFIPVLREMTFPIPDAKIIHEKAHWDQFKQEGLTPIVGFFFVDLEVIDQGVGVQLFTSHREVPSNMTDEDYYQAMKRVTAAPEDLSSHDTKRLGKE